MNNEYEENEDNSKVPNLKSKESLYSLFYEITSEIKGEKIEIDEEEFQDNIKSISMSQLINYIHDSIQILLKKKIQDAKEEQKKEDLKENIILGNNNINAINQYENILQKLEYKERKLTKLYFQNKLQKQAMENKIGEYIEIENEFEEMKIKLKYEDGRFLDNDRKENEIIILRQENVNLKAAIKENEEKIKTLESDISNKENEISSLKDSMEQLKIKLDEKQKELNLFSNINININNNNNSLNNNNSNINKKYSFLYSKNLNTNNLLSNGTKEEINSSSIRNEHSFGMKILNFKKAKNMMMKKKNKNNESLSNTRNDIIERTKLHFISKYFVNQNRNNNISVNSNLNNSFIKITRLPPSNIKNNLNIYNNNNNKNSIPILGKHNNNIQQNQIFNYSHKNSFTTRKPSNRALISYKAISCD